MKKLISAVLVCLLLVLQAFPVYAQTSTSSNWVADARKASPSDWNFFTPFDWDAYEAEFGISPAAGSLPDVTTTASYKDIALVLQYYDMSSNYKTARVTFNSSYYASLPVPSDLARIDNIQIRVGPTSLPAPGNYSVKMKFSSNTGIEYSRFLFGSWKNNTNATTSASSTSSKAVFSQFSGDWSAVSTVQIGSGVYLYFNAYPKNTGASTLPYGGYVSLEFTKTTATPDYTTAGGPQSSQDIQQDISNSAGQIANNTEAINGTLKELIQHISNQLAALWDQMYNFMHVPLVNNDNARTQRIIDRLDEGFDINVETIDRNFHDLMANDDKNTNTVVNGFDNSKFNSANNQLQASIDVYDKTETDIFDSVKGDITGFQIPDFTSNVQVLAAVGFSSNYLQRLFNAIGLFNLPVTVSLVMIFVLMVLGYYRVRN